jgi:hypothetical protein
MCQKNVSVELTMSVLVPYETRILDEKNLFETSFNIRKLDSYFAFVRNVTSSRDMSAGHLCQAIQCDILLSTVDSLHQHHRLLTVYQIRQGDSKPRQKCFGAKTFCPDPYST